MNRIRIEGLRARACGLSRVSNPHASGSDGHREWQAGWESMDQQIGNVLSSAECMLESLQELRGQGRGGDGAGSTRLAIRTPRPAAATALSVG